MRSEKFHLNWLNSRFIHFLWLACYLALLKPNLGLSRWMSSKWSWNFTFCNVYFFFNEWSLLQCILSFTILHSSGFSLSLISLLLSEDEAMKRKNKYKSVIFMFLILKENIPVSLIWEIRAKQINKIIKL